MMAPLLLSTVIGTASSQHSKSSLLLLLAFVLFLEEGSPPPLRLLFHNLRTLAVLGGSPGTSSLVLIKIACLEPTLVASEAVVLFR